MSNVSDEPYERLQILEAEILAALKLYPNEADTRFKALDRILIEIMGWPRETISTEPPTESGYIDYLIKSNQAGAYSLLKLRKQACYILKPNLIRKW